MQLEIVIIQNICKKKKSKKKYYLKISFEIIMENYLLTIIIRSYVNLFEI